MAYIGNTVQTQGFAPAIDYFSGNGSTVTFTLSRNIASVAQVICAIDNVIQNPSSAYTVSGNAITFTSAPLSGTNNIWVEYTSLITTYAAISQSPSVIGDITATGGYLSTGSFNNSFLDGTIVDYVTGNGRVTVGPADGFTIYTGGTSARTALMTLDSSGNFTNNATGYTAIATGTTAQRPGTPTAGMVRYNSTNAEYEVYQSSSWRALTTQSTGQYYVSYLVAAGGGGGGSSGSGGGGGAGGVSTGSTLLLVPGTTYTATIGSGGVGSVYGSSTVSTAGGNSSFSSITALGGGRGGDWSVGSGGDGGSGGGASGGGAASGGSGTSGQGSAGGSAPGGANYGSGGGGGAGAVGTAGSGSAGGVGGVGSVTTLITTTQATSASVGQVVSSSVYFGGGGGGGIYYAAGGIGGSGGGGNANAGSGQTGSAGTTNTSGGGGGGGSNGSNLPAGGAGGSGCVIISVPTAKYTGTTSGSPTIVTNGSNTVLIFKSSGTYTA